MIVYENTLGQFLNSVRNNEIVGEVLSALKEYGFHNSEGEVNSWHGSLNYMKNVLEVEFPLDLKVAIEYNIPQTAKRVDFLILGSDENKRDNIVIVELKGWRKVEAVESTYKYSIRSDMRSNPVTDHPSHQAFTYRALISNYCEDLQKDKVGLVSCAYLHNMDADKYRSVIEDSQYKLWIEEAPAFLAQDIAKLRAFIKKYASSRAHDGTLLYKIDHGRIRPQKALQDSLDSMLLGNQEFHLLDEQAVASDQIMHAIRKSLKDKRKRVVIVRGGPGTGKSVLAINVLVECIRDLGINASYITKNSAPRQCYKYLLSRGDARKEVDLKLLFRSPHTLPFIPKDGIDVGIYDEAHRMQKSPYMYKGDNMLREAIYAAKVSVFFVDEDQRITVNDIYDIESIYKEAALANAIVEENSPIELTSQFRCNGSDEYIAFLDNLLGIQETANKTFKVSNFDLRIYSDPNKMRDDLREYNKIKNKARMISGYCYDWNVKYKRGEYDIELINDFKAKWNLESDQVWAVNPQSFEEVGCIHTCQGMEFDYVGVIIGKDLLFRNEKVITDRNKVSKDDRTSGIRLRTTHDNTADRIIRNTYKVLLTRGQKGCFIYCEDKDLYEYLSKFIKTY